MWPAFHPGCMSQRFSWRCSWGSANDGPSLTCWRIALTAHRPVFEGYSLPLLDQLITIVSSITIMTYSIYTFSAENLPVNHTMMLTIPFVIYGIFRYLYLVQVQQSGDAPEEVLLTDRPLQVTLLLWGLTIFLIIYVFQA
jgi:hypothetical protein